MEIFPKYEPTHPDSKFVKCFYYFHLNGNEYELMDAVNRLYKAKVFDSYVFNKLKNKNTSAQTIAATIKPYLHLLINP